MKHIFNTTLWISPVHIYFSVDKIHNQNFLYTLQPPKINFLVNNFSLFVTNFVSKSLFLG